MLGLFGVLSECVVPGANPTLDQFNFPQREAVRERFLGAR